MRRTAFTLAEILITLAIIGVVAAITIPSLMQSTQDAELKTAWKKTFAELSNATNQLVQDNGGNISGACSSTNHNCLRDLYKSYLKYQKICDSTDSIGICWPNYGEFVYLDNSVVQSAFFGSNRSGLVLNDGTLLLFYFESNICDFANANWDITRCAGITIDVNGFKKPNKFGKDMFNVHLLKDGIKPYGTSEDNLKDKCEGSVGRNSGYSCSAEYLYN